MTSKGYSNLTGMIYNKLNFIEFEKIFEPITQLQSVVSIKKQIYNILRFTKVPPSEFQQYIINGKFSGVKSMYEGYEVEIKRLHDSGDSMGNSYSGTIIKLSKKKGFVDYFRNPNTGILNDLENIFKKEFKDLTLIEFNPGGYKPVGVKEHWFYQKELLNSNWKQDNCLSPLQIYLREEAGSYLIEVVFLPLCYERLNNKTVKKDNWIEIFNQWKSFMV